MNTTSLSSVLLAVGGKDASPAADADLLARFDGGDQAAFTELVRRYARLVWRVARTRCRSDATAEDVFQATFIVLSRKAGSIRAGGALAGWLHRTAHRLAVRAARKERPAVPLPVQLPTSANPLDALTARELLSAVDDEMTKLSDAERTVLVLCGIDGLTNDEAAKRLGTTTGSVKGRLERARAKLRVQLDARGLTLPAVALGLIGGPASSAVQAALTVPHGGAIPPGVEHLIEGLRMTGTKTAALTLLAVLAAVGVWAGVRPAPPVNAAPVPKAGADDGLLWLHNTKTGALTAYAPDGRKQKEWTLKDGQHFLGLTPDGTKIAFAGKKGKLAAEGEADGLTLHLRDVNDQTDGTDTGLALKPGDAVHWSPDSKQVVRLRWGPQDKANNFTYDHRLFDLATKEETKVDLPVNLYMRGWAADGKTWHLHEYVRADLRNPNLPRYRMLVVPAGGGEVTPLCDAASLTTFEPAGGKAFHGVGNAHKNPVDDTDATYRRWLRVSDGQATLVKVFDDFDSVDLRSSPDRKRVVVLGSTSHDESSDTVLLLYDADGSGEQKLVTLKKEGQHTRLLGWFPKHADARKRNAPVPKKAEPEKLVVWSQPLKEETGYAATHGIWSPDGKHVITGGQVPGARGGEWPGELRVWNAETSKLIHTHHGEISYVTRPTTVAITPDGKMLAVAGYGNTQPRRFTLDLFDWGEEKPKASLKLNKPATGVLLSADGSAVYTLDMRGDLSAREVKTEKLLWTTALGQELNWGLAFWNEGKDLLAADEGGNVRRFDAATGKELSAMGKFDIKALSLNVSKDGRRVAVGGYAGSGPIVIDCTDHQPGEFRSVQLPATVQANQVSLSPDGKFLAVACSGKENMLKVFDAATGKLLAEGKEHAGAVTCAQYSPDGKRLLTVGQDAIKVWTVSELMKAK